MGCEEPNPPRLCRGRWGALGVGWALEWGLGIGIGVGRWTLGWGSGCVLGLSWAPGWGSGLGFGVGVALGWGLGRGRTRRVRSHAGSVPTPRSQPPEGKEEARCFLRARQRRTKRGVSCGNGTGSGAGQRSAAAAWGDTKPRRSAHASADVALRRRTTAPGGPRAARRVLVTSRRDGRRARHVGSAEGGD